MLLYSGGLPMSGDVRCLKSIHALRFEVETKKYMQQTSSDDNSVFDPFKELKLRVQYVGSNGLVSELIPFTSLIDAFSLSNAENGSYRVVVGSYFKASLYGTVVLSPGTLKLDDHHFLQVSLSTPQNTEHYPNIKIYGIEGVNLTDVAYKLNPLFVPQGVRTVSFERGNNFAFGFRVDNDALEQIVLSSQNRSMTVNLSELEALGQMNSDIAFCLACRSHEIKVTGIEGNDKAAIDGWEGNKTFVRQGQFPIVTIPCKSDVWSSREEQPEIQSFQITTTNGKEQILYGIERIRL